MKFKELAHNERGVSPVIGVILMVAITVILAAVIGTFVLGLGGQVSETTPQASITITDSDPGFITVAHDGGDSFRAGDIDVYVDGNSEGSLNGLSPSVGADSSISPGQSIEVDITNTGNGKQVKLVHTPSGQLLAQGKVDIS